MGTPRFFQITALPQTSLGRLELRLTRTKPRRHAYEEAGATGVPMFEIGSQVLSGLQDRETLEAVIEEELAANKDV